MREEVIKNEMGFIISEAERNVIAQRKFEAHLVRQKEAQMILTQTAMFASFPSLMDERSWKTSFKAAAATTPIFTEKTTTDAAMPEINNDNNNDTNNDNNDNNDNEKEKDAPLDAVERVMSFREELLKKLEN